MWYLVASKSKAATQQAKKMLQIRTSKITLMRFSYWYVYGNSNCWNASKIAETGAEGVFQR